MLHVLSSLQANEIYSESLKIGAMWQWDPVQSFRLSGRSVIVKDREQPYLKTIKTKSLGSSCSSSVVYTKPPV